MSHGNPGSFHEFSMLPNQRANDAKSYSTYSNATLYHLYTYTIRNYVRKRASNFNIFCCPRFRKSDNSILLRLLSAEESPKTDEEITGKEAGGY